MNCGHYAIIAPELQGPAHGSPPHRSVHPKQPCLSVLGPCTTMDFEKSVEVYHVEVLMWCVQRVRMYVLVHKNAYISMMTRARFCHSCHHKYSYICMYLRTHSHIHAYTLAHTHTHTHTNTHTQAHTHTHTTCDYIYMYKYTNSSIRWSIHPRSHLPDICVTWLIHNTWHDSQVHILRIA